MMVKDINDGDGDSYPLQLTPFGNTMYFVADNGINGFGCERVMEPPQAR